MWNPFQPRREAVKALLREGIEIDTNDANDYMYSCIEQAAYPQVTKNGEPEVRSKAPTHDWTSHHRSALEYLALGIAENLHRRTTVKDKFKPQYNFTGRRKSVKY